MARKRRSALQDIVEVVAYFPWWVGVVLAIVSYFVLHSFAVAPVVASDPTSIVGGNIVSGKIFSGMARVLQYLLPLFITVGAITSLIQQQKKSRLYGHLKRNPDIQLLKEVGWQEFELLVGKHFEEKGFIVRQLAQPGPDGGIDLVVIKDNEKYLVQCKQWRSVSVGVKIVRELLGTIVSSGAVGGFVVCSGKFTRDAEKFAKGTNIELIDGREIIKSLEKKCLPGVEPSFKDSIETKLCPRCREAMVLRTAKKGASAGKQFWGCASYPRCRGTRSL